MTLPATTPAAVSGLPAPAQAVPKVRLSMHVTYRSQASHKEGRVSVHEQAGTVKLAILEPTSTFPVEATLTLAEAAELAHHLNLIRRRIVNRPSWKP